MKRIRCIILGLFVVLAAFTLFLLFSILADYAVGIGRNRLAGLTNTISNPFD